MGVNRGALADFKKLKKEHKNKSVRPETEAPVERHLFKRTRRMGFRAVKFEDPSFKGAPDRLILGDGAFVEFVETKTPLGKLSDAQVVYHKGLRSKGFRVRVINTKELVEGYVLYLKNYLKILKAGL